MKIEFDPRKDQSNLAKHGVPLALGGQILLDPTRVVLIDDRFDYGETRLIAIGAYKGQVFTAVYTMRGDIYRFFSVRKAHGKKKARYERDGV